MLNAYYALRTRPMTAAEVAEFDAALEDDTPAPTRAEQRARFLALAEGGRI